MYRASEKTKQPDIWKNPGLEMGKRSRAIFEDSEAWHHRFRREVTNRVNEDIFKPLYSEGTGAPNAPIRILVSMMALKEAQGISDEQLYEQARFNTLIRSALGLINSDEEVPTESTYYLFRHKITEYAEQTGKNLLEQAFEQITMDQCHEYKVSGKRIRMDSKLLGSNIGYYSRYGIVHETIRKYCHANGIENLSGKDAELTAVLKEKADAVTYRSTKEEVEGLLEGLGLLMYRLVGVQDAQKNKEYELLKRVFEDQYELVSGPGGGKKKKVVLRDKTQISGRSVQSPHDPDSEYRDKGGNKVKGYSVNVTETCDEGSPGNSPLNLIVGIQTEGSGTPDVDYLQKGIEQAQKLVVEKIEELNTDGAFHSPLNQEYCKKKNIDWVLGGIQGRPSKYDLSYDSEGNMVVMNKESGERLEAKRSKRRDPQAPERWRVKDGDKSPIYFEQKDVETCELRKKLEQIPKERLNVRNNVEATIFQLGYHYRSDKSSYRGTMKHHLWALSRSLWVNFRRIQLWCMRKRKNGDNGGSVMPEESYVLIFFQRVFCKFLETFCSPVLEGYY